MRRILIPLADGVEEMEAVIVTDVLRRAHCSVTTASVGRDLTVTASRGVRLLADCLWRDIGSLDPYIGIVIPGGAGGTQALCASEDVLRVLQAFNSSGKHIGAICAGPLVLQAAGLLAGRRFTCYPGVEKEIQDAIHCSGNVVCDRNLITSRGPGTAFEFALALISAMSGDDHIATTLRRQLVLLA
jgi:4-methyl-5(b-hydroxyethyl)-thiazole monophosphate biosynthesis